jgi:hypothetical protein
MTKRICAQTPTEQSANRDCVTVESSGVPGKGRAQAVGLVTGRGLTRMQAKALLFVCSFWQEHGFSPSFDEVREAMGLASKAGAFRLLHALVDREYLLIDRARARSMRLTPAAMDWISGLGASRTSLAA